MKPFEGIEHLKAEHELLRAEFEALGRAHGVLFSHEQLTDKELYFSRTVLDSKSGDRQLYINLTERGEAPSAYVKAVGWEDDSKRLVINVEKVEGNVDLLWTAYVLWLIDRVEEQEMEAFAGEKF